MQPKAESTQAFWTRAIAASVQREQEVTERAKREALARLYATQRALMESLDRIGIIGHGEILLQRDGSRISATWEGIEFEVREQDDIPSLYALVRCPDHASHYQQKRIADLADLGDVLRWECSYCADTVTDAPPRTGISISSGIHP